MKYSFSSLNSISKGILRFGLDRGVPLPILRDILPEKGMASLENFENFGRKDHAWGYF